MCLVSITVLESKSAVCSIFTKHSLYQYWLIAIQTCLRWSYRPLLCHTASPQALPEKDKKSASSRRKKNIELPQHYVWDGWMNLETLQHHHSQLSLLSPEVPAANFSSHNLFDLIWLHQLERYIFVFHPLQNKLLKYSLGLCIKVRIFVYCKPFRSGAEKGDFHKFYACTTSLLQRTIRD